MCSVTMKIDAFVRKKLRLNLKENALGVLNLSTGTSLTKDVKTVHWELTSQSKVKDVRHAQAKLHYGTENIV